jgi:general secretion pathway protein E
MSRLTLTPDAVRVRGALGRTRTLYYEDLRGARAEGGRVVLVRRGGEPVSVPAPDAAAAVATLNAILEGPPATADLPGLRAAVQAWDALPGFLAAPFVDHVLRAAAQLGASDLHLQPSAGGEAGLSVRLDGVLQPVGRLPGARARRVVGRLKVMAGAQAHRDDVPQEGRAALDAGWVRLSFAPTVGGEAVTARLFDRLKGEATLEELGFDPATLADLRALLARPSGALLFAGPSASGKTTTLYTALRTLLAESGGTLRAVSVEDPVEYALPGVVQLEVDAGRRQDGGALLTAALRHDADVLVVGELRARDSVEVMLRAGLTGHRVLSTVHAGTPAEALARLLERGADPGLVGTAVAGVLAQRLVRRRCACADGCPACQHTRYRGRVAVGVLQPMTDALRAALHHAGPDARALTDPTTPTLRARAAPLTDPAELTRVFGPPEPS